MLSVSLLAATPIPAHADWFGQKLFASIFSSFFSKVKSLFTTSEKTPQGETSGMVQANCIPPVPPRPADINKGTHYASINITPEVSTAGPDNIVTIAVTPKNLDVVESVGISGGPVDVTESDLIDWYPKDPATARFTQHRVDIAGPKKGMVTAYGWGLRLYDRSHKTLPIDQTYWVKVRMRNASIPEKARDMMSADGWRKIYYHIGNAAISAPSGTHSIYVGREQKPSLITTIPNYNPKISSSYGGFSKPFTLVPNEHFEIQTKSLGQAGTITLKVKNAKVIDGETRVVKADETITWKIQPLKLDLPLLLELSLKNSCGEDYFRDQPKAAELADFDKFAFWVEYDFAKLATDMVNLTVEARNPSLAPLFVGGKYDQYDNSYPIFASIFTKGETKVPVPDVPITFQAFYKDNQTEEVKNLVFQMYASGGNGRKGAGEITINTLKDSTGIGSAFLNIVGSKITAKDAKRGIIIKTTSSRFPGLSAEMAVPIIVSKEAESQPKPLAPISKPEPTPKPTPIEQSKKVPQSLIVSASQPFEGIKEGDKITFTAKLVMTDGSSQVLNDNVAWSVAGKIGSIASNGIFTAKLDPLVAEYGEGVGFIIAVYKDASGKEFIGQTPIFKVKTFVSEDFIPEDVDTPG